MNVFNALRMPGDAHHDPASDWFWPCPVLSVTGHLTGRAVTLANDRNWLRIAIPCAIKEIVARTATHDPLRPLDLPDFKGSFHGAADICAAVLDQMPDSEATSTTRNRPRTR